MASATGKAFEAGWPSAAGTARRSARRHRRVELTMPISILYKGGERGPGVLSDLSLRGASVIAPKAPLAGDLVTLRIGDIGDLPARVRRLAPSGFAAELLGDRRARCALADALTIHLNKPESFVRAVRYPQDQDAVLQLDDGRVARCTVINLSETGAKLTTALIPLVGESVRVGARRGMVERHLPGGIAVSFPLRTPR
ncbi:PilZ domain-containing protein [Parvularcula maris]|uniref:PilZ domain-containing protein n=1 Tax=Parvularcula maris TaxID=2965077 RepID=A0A9X2LAH8_9PROT|nr:PilZ domain-containing protein [Parvularcula maris]MCQ8186126.1 PilZ domain-containing protein [Parvularcula maris]